MHKLQGAYWDTLKGPSRADYNAILDGLAGIKADIPALIEKERALRDQFRPNGTAP